MRHKRVVLNSTRTTFRWGTNFSHFKVPTRLEKYPKYDYSKKKDFREESSVEGKLVGLRFFLRKWFSLSLWTGGKGTLLTFTRFTP